MRQLILCCAWIGAALASSASMAGTSAIENDTESVKRNLTSYMQKAAEKGFTGGVLVAREEEVLLQDAYGERIPGSGEPVALDTVSTTGSITKQFTAAAVMLLQQRGALSIGDTLDEWFDNVPSDKASITLHHLLSHQSGLPPIIGEDDERIARDAWLKQAFEAELLYPPGDGYEYSNVGYSIAAAIVENVSGEPYEVFLRKNFFEPLGMRDTGYHLPDDAIRRLAHGRKDDGSDWGSVYENFIADGGPGWNLVGNGGIHSTPADMLLWHRALQDRAILNESSTEALYGQYAEEPGGTWYGYGWATTETPWGSRLVMHNGGNRFFFADFLRFPDDDIVVYLWTTSREARLKNLAEPLAQITYGETPPEIAPPLPPRVPVDSGTAVGDLVMRTVELVTGDNAVINASAISGIVHPDLLEKHGTDKLSRIFATIREEADESSVLGMRLFPNDRVDIELDSVNGVMALELGLQEFEGPKIRSIGLRIGD